MEEKKKIERKFKKACKLLNEVINDAKKIWPEAGFYAEDSCTLLLMSEPTHINGKSNEAAIIHCEFVSTMTGGGF